MKKNLSALFILILVFGAIGIHYLVKKPKETQSSAPPTTPNTFASQDTAILQLVETFGKKLQLVSLTSPQSSINNYLDIAYQNVVDPETLAAWKKNPKQAPGRKTSSPWPDHIIVNSLVPRGPSVTEVSGYIIYLTSEEALHGGEAGREPIILTVAGSGTEARITRVESELTGNLRPTTTYRFENAFELDYPTNNITEDSGCYSMCQFGKTVRRLKVNGKVFNADNKNNFNGADLTISASTSPAQGACSSFSDISYILPPQIRSTTINDIVFSTVTTSDAGMSRYYDIHIYRTLVRGTCFEIIANVGTTNAEVYEPPRQKFDIKKAFSLLEGIMSTVRFVK